MKRIPVVARGMIVTVVAILAGLGWSSVPAYADDGEQRQSPPDSQRDGGSKATSDPGDGDSGSAGGSRQPERTKPHDAGSDDPPTSKPRAADPSASAGDQNTSGPSEPPRHTQRSKSQTSSAPQRSQRQQQANQPSTGGAGQRQHPDRQTGREAEPELGYVFFLSPYEIVNRDQKWPGDITVVTRNPTNMRCQPSSTVGRGVGGDAPTIECQGADDGSTATIETELLLTMPNGRRSVLSDWAALKFDEDYQLKARKVSVPGEPVDGAAAGSSGPPGDSGNGLLTAEPADAAGPGAADQLDELARIGGLAVLLFLGVGITAVGVILIRRH